MGLRPIRELENFALSRAATGLLLLFLIGHAFVATSTHIHMLAGANVNAHSGTFFSNDEKTRNAPYTGKHEQCLLCRLQRDFVSDVQQATPAIAAPRFESLKHEVLQVSLVLGAHLLSPPGRAPPPV